MQLSVVLNVLHAVEITANKLPDQYIFLTLPQNGETQLYYTSEPHQEY